MRARQQIQAVRRTSGETECGEWESKRTEKITFVHEPVELSQAGEMKQRDAEEMDANKKAKKERKRPSFEVEM